ncbi:15666_t:CDS:2, partial [Dentiscutata heterogama]
NLHLFNGEIDNVFFNLQAKYGEMFEVFIGSERKIWLGDAKLIKKINDHHQNQTFQFVLRNRGTMVTQSIMIYSFLSQFVQNFLMNWMDTGWFQEMNLISQNGFTKTEEKKLKYPKDEILSSDILTLFICVNAERSMRINKENIPMVDDEIMQLMLESITGGSTLCFTISFLCLNPVAIYEEIDRIFCNDRARPITTMILLKMTYTEACIKESLRIIPIAPILYK